MGAVDSHDEALVAIGGAGLADTAAVSIETHFASEAGQAVGADPAVGNAIGAGAVGVKVLGPYAGGAGEGVGTDLAAGDAGGADLAVLEAVGEAVLAGGGVDQAIVGYAR